ncbi:hypothetical protein BRCON_2107 [Candidatus Sumerlaea chitinivorans]|uniref:Uncharacterized protein n=1 Tax=Sumerlaea chitinivorans TaxID=2250252 RepID=A0A2Z4Y6Q1_SUMC1|nr:hypothetical protein BRCON_2107 [Candidatus Sumerlaea chitinivorans]
METGSFLNESTGAVAQFVESMRSHLVVRSSLWWRHFIVKSWYFVAPPLRSTCMAPNFALLTSLYPCGWRTARVNPGNVQGAEGRNVEGAARRRHARRSPARVRARAGLPKRLMFGKAIAQKRFFGC